MNRITFAPIFVEIQEKNYLIYKNASAILAFIRIEIIMDFFYYHRLSFTTIQ